MARERARNGMRACRVGEAAHPTQGLRPTVDGLVLTSVPVRRTQDQHGRVQGFFRARQWSSIWPGAIRMMSPSSQPQLVPCTNWCRAPFPTWVDDSCRTPESQLATPFVRVGAAASRRLRRGGRNVVPRIHESHPVDGEVLVSAHTVGSSEILDALEEDLPVMMFDSDSQISRNVPCEVNNTNQRSSRRLVLCVDRGPTQESIDGVPTAHDSVEATFEDGEPGSERGSSTPHTDGGCGRHGQCG